MTDTRFTPGPWHCTSKKPRQVSDKRGFKIAKCLLLTKGANFEISEQEGLANAHLIAAAPELYEALVLVYEHHRGPDSEVSFHSGHLLHKVSAALAKARGQS